MKLRTKISNKLLIKLALFAVLTGFAFLLDNYFEKNPVEFNEIEANSGQTSDEFASICLFNPANIFSAKISAQKTSDRKLLKRSHDKFLQKYHQLRNYQVLKSDAKTEMVPLVLSYHHIVFRSYFFSLPDDEPHIS